MSMMNEYFVEVDVRQHHRELLAEAQSNRLAREARALRSAGPLRRLLRRLTVTKDAPSAGRIEPRAEAADAASATADREPVGAGRVNSL